MTLEHEIARLEAARMDARAYRLYMVEGWVEYHALVAYAIRLWDDEHAAWSFLCRPHPGLGGWMPVEVLYEGDASMVRRLLDAMDRSAIRQG